MSNTQNFCIAVSVSLVIVPYIKRQRKKRYYEINKRNKYFE